MGDDTSRSIDEVRAATGREREREAEEGGEGGDADEEEI